MLSRFIDAKCERQTATPADSRGCVLSAFRCLPQAVQPSHLVRHKQVLPSLQPLRCLRLPSSSAIFSPEASQALRTFLSALFGLFSCSASAFLSLSPLPFYISNSKYCPALCLLPLVPSISPSVGQRCFLSVSSPPSHAALPTDPLIHSLAPCATDSLSTLLAHPFLQLPRTLCVCVCFREREMSF